MLDEPESVVMLVNTGAAGAVLSTSTPVVVGGVKVSVALFPATSCIVPPFRTMGEADAIPFVSVSPA